MLKSENPQDLPSPQISAFLDSPISKLDKGLNPILTPKYSESDDALACSNSPNNKEKSHGPIQFKNLDLKGSEKVRSIEITGIGLAPV